MKNNSSLISKPLACLFALLLCLFSQTSLAVIRDGNIDPANLGKGDWIYYTSMATNKLGGNVLTVTNETSLMQFYKSQGIEYFIVKAATSNFLFNGSYATPQFTTNLCNIAHANGIKIFGYNRSSGGDIPGEIAISDYVFNCGADGFVWDAEGEWESSHPWIGANGPALAWQLCSTVRSNWPNKFLAHAPFPIISLHSSFPYKEFGFWCDAVMPQIYPAGWTGVKSRPSGGINWTDVNWKNFQNNLYTLPTTNIGGVAINWTNSIKPLAPVNHVYGPNPPNTGVTEIPSEFVMEFVDYLAADPNSVTAGGYKGANFYRADLHGAAQWANIKKSTIGNFTNVVNNIVIDDPTATKVGSWTMVRVFYNGTYYGATGSDTNCFGTNYLTKAAGTGAAYVQFTPNVITAGDYDVYQWHVYRADASSSAPFVINYSGGSMTVNANQTTNAGKWTLLGRFPFAVGTSGNIRVMDNVPNGVPVADGVKLIYAGPTAPPAAPTGLTAISGDSQVALSWNASAGATSYNVKRAASTGGPYSTIAPGVTATSYTDTSAVNGTTYFYVVSAVSSGGESSNSNEATATPQTPPPVAPTGLIASGGNAIVNLSWIQSSSPGITQNNVYRSTNGSGGPYSVIATLAATTSYSDTDVVNGTSYFYTVTAINGAGESAPSTYAGATPSCPLPATPTGLTATPANAQVALSWSAASGAASYNVKRATVSGGPYTTIAGNVAGTSYTDTTAANGTTYYYVVSSVNSCGESANSSQVSATPSAPATPAAPSNLTAVAGKKKVTITWTDNSANETGFKIERSTDGVNFSQITTVGANITSYANINLTSGTRYYYQVRAYNANGDSAYSNVANAVAK